MFFVASPKPKGNPTKTKRNLIQICLLVAVLLALPAAVQAQEINDPPFVFTVNNDGTLTLSEYTGSGGDVTIPSSFQSQLVTGIAIDVFFRYFPLTSVTIPYSVTNIARAAFGFCTNLTAITVDPNNPAYSSAGGVLYNQNQTTLIQCPGSVTGSYTITNSVTSIGSSAFYGCTSLTNVTIPYSVTNIGDNVFAYCTSLPAITVDTNNPVYSSVDGVLFNQTQTALIEYPAGNAGSSYTIPNGVTSIGEDAFFHCTSLASVTIPNTVTNIGAYAFDQCGLTNVMIGNGVTRIGDFAFYWCSLASVYFAGNAPSLGLDPFDNSSATPYYLPGTAGWGIFNEDSGLGPSVLWNPQVQTSDASFGVQTNGFGFNITGNSNLVVVVEACTNLTNPVWQPIQTNTLTGGLSYFSDPQWTNYPSRFYGFSWP
jgi:hypothetical protein